MPYCSPDHLVVAPTNERDHGMLTLGDMLSTYVFSNQLKWDLIPPLVMSAYNTAVQTTTKFFFFSCYTGVRCPAQVTLFSRRSSPTHANIHCHTEERHQLAHPYTSTDQHCQRAPQITALIPTHLQPTPGPFPKLATKNHGPYQVV